MSFQIRFALAKFEFGIYINSIGGKISYKLLLNCHADADAFDQEKHPIYFSGSFANRHVKRGSAQDDMTGRSSDG